LSHVAAPTKKRLPPRTYRMPTLPTEMTAIAIRAPGGPEVLVLERRP
jgi:hypothetical protein